MSYKKFNKRENQVKSHEVNGSSIYTKSGMHPLKGPMLFVPICMKIQKYKTFNVDQ